METAIATRHVVADDCLTVTDSTTGLVWSRDDASPERLSYDSAEACIQQLNAAQFAGFTDWRLPTIDELFALADRTRYAPAIDTDAFPNCVADGYWTGTPDAEEPESFAWAVLFGDGGAFEHRRYHDCRVRAVRGPVRQ